MREGREESVFWEEVGDNHPHLSQGRFLVTGPRSLRVTIRKKGWKATKYLL